MSYIPASDSQNILNVSGVIINPATDESILLLRRMVKILDSIATVDSQNRQRVTLDAAPVAVTVIQGTASSLNAVVSQPTASNLNAVVSQPTASNLNANVGTVTNIAGFGGIDPRFQFMEAARISYATGVRHNLQFS
jgi:pyruvate carboxylase